MKASTRALFLAERQEVRQLINPPQVPWKFGFRLYEIPYGVKGLDILDISDNNELELLREFLGPHTSWTVT
jgi:hypothetical protein